MWIRRRTFEKITTETAKLQIELELRKEQIAHLSAQIDYWQAKVEAEQLRADRIGDRMAQASGFGPVSQTGVEEIKALQKEYQSMMKMNMEMFSDEVTGTGEIAVDENLASALVEGLGK